MRMGRPRYEDILTPREWEVLGLIEQGLTNEQIAERLDISYGTAKYHVGEILSKTGAANREEAVRIARRSRRPALPALAPPWLLQAPRLIGARGVLVLAGGSVTAIVALAVILGGWFSGGNGDSDHLGLAALQDFEPEDEDAKTGPLVQSLDDLETYYFEARIEVEGDDTDDVLDTMKGWYEAPDRWRWEVGSSDPSRAHETVIQVSDGNDVWFYQGRTNTVEVQSLEEALGGMPPELWRGPPPISFSVPIGLMPAYIDALSAGAAWEEKGLEDVAGITARVVEMLEDDWTLTLWLHPDLPFILRSLSESRSLGGAKLMAEVVQLELNRPLGNTEFAFVPPPDAIEVEAEAASGSGGSGWGYAEESTTVGSVMEGGPGGGIQSNVPDGFLRAAYLPEGYMMIRESSSSSGQRTTSFEVRLRPGGPQGADYLDIEQRWRAGGLPESQRDGRIVAINGAEGYSQEVNGELRLTWSQGDIIVTLRTNSLPLEELLRIAESMR